MANADQPLIFNQDRAMATHRDDPARPFLPKGLAKLNLNSAQPISASTQTLYNRGAQ